MGQRTVFDTKSFIEKATAKYGNKFDYSLVNYINSSTKVTIICPEHGVFQQTPNNHLKIVRGCTKCRQWKNDLDKTNSQAYRNNALRVHGEECAECGFNLFPQILQVHHKNHNREDNAIENLIVLCPNCHMIEHYVKHGSTREKPKV